MAASDRKAAWVVAALLSLFRLINSADKAVIGIAAVPTMQDVATRIVNEVQSVNRVVYDVTSKPPGTIERGSNSDPPSSEPDAGAGTARPSRSAHICLR